MPNTTKHLEKKSHLTGGSVIEGVQESTFYSMNQSQDDTSAIQRVGHTPMT